MVRRPQGGVLARDLELRRRAGRAGRPCAGRCRPDAGRALVSRRAAQLRAEPARTPARGRRRRCARVLGRGQGQAAVSHAQLHAGASRVADALAAHGVAAGDRVAAFMPNMPETIIAMLGAAARGAIWSSCSPDFGVQGVLDRFGQIEPRVLFTVDGYWYNGKAIPILDKVAAIVARLPSVERVVVVPYLQQTPGRVGRSRVGAGGAAVGRVARAVAAGPDRLRAACRSTIRSTSCIRPAPPACRSASSTAPAARCCST